MVPQQVSSPCCHSCHTFSEQHCSCMNLRRYAYVGHSASISSRESPYDADLIRLACALCFVAHVIESSRLCQRLLDGLITSLGDAARIVWMLCQRTGSACQSASRSFLSRSPLWHQVHLTMPIGVQTLERCKRMCVYVGLNCWIGNEGYSPVKGFGFAYFGSSSWVGSISEPEPDMNSQ